MHKCVLKPLRPMVSAALQDFQVRSGAWQQLKENLSLAKAQHPQEMGVADMCLPDAVAIEKIRTKLLNMCALYSPEEKVRVLLGACKLIYTLMEDAAGEGPLLFRVSEVEENLTPHPCPQVVCVARMTSCRC